MRAQWRLGLIAASLVLGISLGIFGAIVNSNVSPSAITAEQSLSPVSESIAAAPAEAAIAPQPLPDRTEAILASAAPNGLFNPPRGDVRLVVISDLNSAYGSTDYQPDVDRGIQLMPFWQPDLVLCSGDMVAGQSPSLSDAQIRAMWAAFDEHVAAPLRAMNVPYGFTLGNHDASSARSTSGGFLFQNERDLAAEYWLDPTRAPGLQFADKFEFPFYYTFERKGIFFLVWDGSSSYIPPEKLAWVEQSLASPEARSARMRVLVSHLPLYAVAVGRNTPGEVMQNGDRLREMLERHNVHTYISGHQHAYYPGHRGNLQLLHAGNLGAGPRPLIDSSLPPRKTITVVDIQFDNPDLTTYTTYDIRTLQTIELEQLPRFLVGHNGMILRRDLEWTKLNNPEQAACIRRLGVESCNPSEGF
ncbi:metallophosphoesterase [Synechococcus sp. PCC 7336]|uniref:metallophosphoesterase family protein n=1 Tax=Synechococcus sp. PCC 7336 TaxID=195250 RepID=UPI00037203B2|nr:metallophosphoesterase [Synechococcus sp. PCC 7336]